jgi:AcrR family transcriptional regulator
MADPPDSAQRAGRRTAEERREAVIAAARLLFARNGFHGTGMAEIARVSEVLVGQIYRDFARKEDLIAAIVERDINELLDDPEGAQAIATRNLEQLNNWLRRFIAGGFDQETRSVFADIISEATRNPRIADIVQAAHERLRTRLITAATLWVPGCKHSAARFELAELILTAAGAIQRRHLLGLPANPHVTSKMIEFVETQIAAFRASLPQCDYQPSFEK